MPAISWGGGIWEAGTLRFPWWQNRGRKWSCHPWRFVRQLWELVHTPRDRAPKLRMVSWNLNDLCFSFRWLDIPIIIWEYEWMPRDKSIIPPPLRSVFRGSSYLKWWWLDQGLFFPTKISSFRFFGRVFCNLPRSFAWSLFAFLLKWDRNPSASPPLNQTFSSYVWSSKHSRNFQFKGCQMVAKGCQVTIP